VIFLMIRLMVYAALAPLWLGYHIARMVIRGTRRTAWRGVRRSRSRPYRHHPVASSQPHDRAEDIAARLGVTGYNRGEYPLSGKPPA
jgi:hypothetical protein